MTISLESVLADAALQRVVTHLEPTANLKSKLVKFDKYYAIIRCTGKKGEEYLELPLHQFLYLYHKECDRDG